MAITRQIDSIACRYFEWRLFRRQGVYYADGRRGQYNLGKHSLATRDRTEAIERLRQLDVDKAVEVGLADATIRSAPLAPTIAAGWQLYFDELDTSEVMGGATPGTLKRYRAVRDKHIHFCRKRGIQTWAAFDKPALQAYGKWLAQQKADRTIYLELTLIKSVNSWLIDSNLLPPTAKLVLKLEKPQGTDTYCYSSGEVTAMVRHCRTTAGLAWLGVLIVGLAYTGMRINELAGLRWGDVKLEHGTIRIADERSSRRKRAKGSARTTKGRRSRTIPIHPELRQCLEDLPRHQDGYVFRAAQGGRVHARNVLEQFIKHVIDPLKATFVTLEGDIGFEHGRLHSFRHFFCSQCFLGGASEGEIKEWLGHADSKMVEHYRHLRNEDAQRKMNQIRFLEPTGAGRSADSQAKPGVDGGTSNNVEEPVTQS